jgi:2-C-methyl-D-erythritol 2,4-cyclodiphosphate synthase
LGRGFDLDRSISMRPGVRVGIGFDFHPFDVERKLFLGGIEIDHPRGLLGHSDADVLIHSLIDALLGAVGMGDIGTLFPDSDPRYREISSVSLLQDTCRLVQDAGWTVGNVDIVVIAEEPPINPYRDNMKTALGNVLQVSPDEIGIKATTMEGRGLIGRREGIAAQAVALLYQQ